MKDKKLRDKKKLKSEEFNQKNELVKKCKICGDKELIESFDNMTNKCSECSQKSKDFCHNRNPRDKIIGKIYNIKKAAKRRLLSFELSDDETIRMIQLPCHYCDDNNNDIINSLDRVDSKLGYIKKNCVPCCEQCNLMKHIHSKENFIQICEHILTIQKLYNGKLNHSLFKIPQNSTFNIYKNTAAKRNITFDISEDEFKKIVLQKCSYCKSNDNNYYGIGAGGIDRIESDKEYSIKNCTPCCTTCNIMKLNYTKEQFLVKCVKIINHQNNNQNLEDEIIHFFEKYSGNKDGIKRLNPSFFHSRDYYEFRKFNGNIDDVKNIDIELEFVKSSEQIDLWNYFRWTISSLRIYKPTNFVGRIICILVKDKNTQKYLGIMSLSSDIIYMSDRDKAIGWNNHEKTNNKKLNNLMNLSTCVAIQPFGFNFNAGKLITKLAFSSEIMNKFREKYNQELLVISTTGLYGKSIQYDRLTELKLVGMTKGNSVYWITKEITAKCRKYLKIVHNINVNNYDKLHVISKIISVLGLDKEEVITGNKKGIYLGFTRPDAKSFLCGETNQLKEHNFKSAKEIFNDWINRWAIQRYNHLIETNKLIEYKYTPSSERASRYYQKLKKDFGEEEYKQFIKDKNKKYFDNKKSCEENKKNIIAQEDDSEQEIDPNELDLPNNFSIGIKDKNYNLLYCKTINHKLYKKSQKIVNNDLQQELDRFIELINSDFEGNIFIEKYKIKNIPDKYKSLVTVDINTKPIMPNNFSICSVNNVDYIQFCKKINNKKYQYKTLIKSNEIQTELDNFIDYLNSKYNFKLNKTDYNINNFNNWKTKNLTNIIL